MEKMNILIDARLMRVNKNGPSSYAKNVLLHLSKIDSHNNYTVLVNTEYPNFINSERFHVIPTEIKPYRIREHWAIPDLIKDMHFDLFHCMQFAHPLFIKYTTVLTVYDTMHMENSFWDDSVLRRLKGKYMMFISKVSIRKSVGIVTISKYSAAQISSVFGYDIGRIYPIHLGVTSRYFNRNRKADSLYSMQKWGITNPYLLCVGNMRPYKNIDILINAFAQIVRNGFKDVSLVLAGKASDVDLHERQKIAFSLGLKDKVIFLKNINEEDLAALMGGASVFIFPSKKEGFGLPLLEALATGTPCIASDIEVFRELCEDSVRYFQPDDAFALKDNIINLLLSSDGIREQITSLGVQNARRYSWENTARKTLSMYKELFDKSKNNRKCA